MFKVWFRGLSGKVVEKAFSGWHSFDRFRSRYEVLNGERRFTVVRTQRVAGRVNLEPDFTDLMRDLTK